MNRGKGSHNIPVQDFMHMINPPLDGGRQESSDALHAQRILAAARAHNARMRQGKGKR